jgi:ribosomal protein S18 acetylase RimI-like enzyme
MIEYVDSIEGVTPAMLSGFFEGWKKSYTSESHLIILENSDHIVLALDTERNRVVGFITALTDGIMSAFIPLLEVLPDYRNQGIGSSLVLRMLEKLKDIPGINLMCDQNLQSFYSRFGMSPSSGMILRNY